VYSVPVELRRMSEISAAAEIGMATRARTISSFFIA
jgi:hypothetical protein